MEEGDDDVSFLPVGASGAVVEDEWADGPAGGGSSGSGSSGGSSGSTGGSGGGTSSPPVSSRAAVAVQAALAQQGTPYRYATSSPGVGFDCSGLTAYAWAQAGVYLPHQSRAQYAALPHVSVSEAQPGDLIFFYSPISHVAIYIGNGQAVHGGWNGTTVIAGLSTIHGYPSAVVRVGAVAGERQAGEREQQRGGGGGERSGSRHRGPPVRVG